MTLSEDTKRDPGFLHDLAAQLLPASEVVADLQRWMAEDGLDRGDVTSNAIVDSRSRVSAQLVARDTLVVCGLSLMAQALSTPPLAGRLEIEPVIEEGSTASSGTVIAEVAGGQRSLLAFERTLLNILGRLSGVASCTRKFVKAVEGTGAVICDTRKTTPGLRYWEKYAVACGGGTLHRLGLHDAALFKDNHLAGIGIHELGDRLAQACREARSHAELKFVEVEVDTMEQFDVVLGLESGLVDIVLLDNMADDERREAVHRRDLSGSSILLEASGGIDLESVHRVAMTGVDRIAVGALTRMATILDIGLDA